MHEISKPVQTVLVTSRGRAAVLGLEALKDNIITMNGHMCVSFDPMLYAISVGKTRFSRKLIDESKVFIVNFISAELKDAAMFCGTHSGEHIDKFDKSGLTREDGTSVDCPTVREASATLECRVVDQVEAGDHIIFIGEVLHSASKSSAKRLFQVQGNGFTGL